MQAWEAAGYGRRRHVIAIKLIIGQWEWVFHADKDGVWLGCEPVMIGEERKW